MYIKITKLCRNHKPGFTLIEIMIVVSIVTLLTAIALPQIYRTRINTNESSALVSIRMISSAAQAYRGVNSTFPDDLKPLGPPPTGASAEAPALYCAAIAQPAYLGPQLGCDSAALYGAAGKGFCFKDGYRFKILEGTASTFKAIARPIRYKSLGFQLPTGKKGFYVQEANVIYETDQSLPADSVFTDADSTWVNDNMWQLE